MEGKSIYIPSAQIFLDSRKKRKCAYISHAHGDHIAPHEKILCTPETADLLRLRLRYPQCLRIPYFQKTVWNDATLTLYPAGHILGSAQIYIEAQNQSLLYSGDFKLKPSRTVKNFTPVQADVLIMETTYGIPKYSFPPRKDIEEELVTLVKSKLNGNIIPVVFAYSLGKGQEALSILTGAGFSVAVDRTILRYCKVYEKYGIQFGPYEKLDKNNIRGKVVLCSIHQRRELRLDQFGSIFTIFLSGWGVDKRAVQKFRVDTVLPFSDHADYNELIEYVQHVKPTQVYCTHGFEEFIHVLREMGISTEFIRVIGQPVSGPFQD
jgi:Cft2 family RNA processing exonuclease